MKWTRTRNLDRELGEPTQSPQFQELEQYANLKTELVKQIWEQEKRIIALEAQMQLFSTCWSDEQVSASI